MRYPFEDFSYILTKCSQYYDTVYFTASCPVLNVSYKPQSISPKSEGTVRQLLHSRIREAYIHTQFVTDVMKPLMIDNIMDQEVHVFSYYTILYIFHHLEQCKNMIKRAYS